jgi:hypothetical protein
MKYKRYKEAVEVYKKLLEYKKNDLQVLTSLITAYSHFDLEAAEQYFLSTPLSLVFFVTYHETKCSKS